MAGVVSQAESDLVYTRIAAICKTMQGLYEEMKRLDSLVTSQNLGTNLDEPSHQLVTKAEAVQLFQGPIADYISFYEEGAAPIDATRRSDIDNFLAIASQIGA